MSLLLWLSSLLAPYKDLFGPMVLFFGVIMNAVGMPMQILKQYRENVAGISFILVLSPVVMLAFRVLYGIAIQAWWMLLPDAIGLLASLVLFGQWCYYPHSAATNQAVR